MTEHRYQESSLYEVDGPVYRDGSWMIKVVLKGQQPEPFLGETREEVQEQVLHYLGQQALEIEKARVSLRKVFESHSDE